MNFAEGFITGVNWDAAEHKHVGATTITPELAGWLRDYCQHQPPLVSYTYAVIALRTFLETQEARGVKEPFGGKVIR